MKTNTYVFGYGSLANQKSITLTLGRVPQFVIPAILEGWQRDWSVVIDNQLFGGRFHIMGGGDALPFVAALNIRQNKGLDNIAGVNGVFFEVTLEELDKFDAREVHYDRVDVTQQIKNAPKESVTYSYTGRDEYVDRFDERKDVVIPKSYLDLVRSGFQDLSQDKLNLFDLTTATSHYPIVATSHTTDAKMVGIIPESLFS